jgi:hypothetical protein
VPHASIETSCDHLDQDISFAESWSRDLLDGEGVRCAVEVFVMVSPSRTLYGSVADRTRTKYDQQEEIDEGDT